MIIRCSSKWLRILKWTSRKIHVSKLISASQAELFSVTHPNCNKLGTAGLPLPFNNVKIVNDLMEDVTYGVPGQLLIQSPALMNCYYMDPKATEEAIYVDSEGAKWYRTGDYAVIDEDGCLTVLDRYVEPVNIGNRENERFNCVDSLT